MSVSADYFLFKLGRRSPCFFLLVHENLAEFSTELFWFPGATLVSPIRETFTNMEVSDHVFKISHLRCEPHFFFRLQKLPIETCQFFWLLDPGTCKIYGTHLCRTYFISISQVMLFGDFLFVLVLLPPWTSL